MRSMQRRATRFRCHQTHHVLPTMRTGDRIQCAKDVYQMQAQRSHIRATAAAITV